MVTKHSTYYFYLFRCQDGSLYAGVAKNTDERQKLHNTGKGSKYIKSRGGGKMAYTEKLPSKSHALRREAEVKKWTKLKKENLISQSRT